MKEIKIIGEIGQSITSKKSHVYFYVCIYNNKSLIENNIDYILFYK